MNRQNVLKARPAGVPDPGNFSMQEATKQPSQNKQLLIRSSVILVDPYVHGLMGSEGYLFGY